MSQTLQGGVKKGSYKSKSALWAFLNKAFSYFLSEYMTKYVLTVSEKCPQSRFLFILEHFHTRLKVLRQPLVWMVIKVQHEACSGLV